MKKIIIAILLSSSIISIGQTAHDSIEKSEVKIETIKNNENPLYELKKDINETTKNFNELKSEFNNLKEEHNNSWVEFTNHWFLGFGSVLLLIVGFFGRKHFIENYQKKIQEEVDEKIAKLTRIEEAFIHKNLSEYKKHINIKETATIYVLNEKGTDFPESFKKVLNLYKGYKEHTTKIDLNGLEEALEPAIINRLKQADIVIIENQVEENDKGDKKHWVIATEKTCSSLDCFKKYATTGTRTVEERQPYQNNLLLIELANAICDNTALIYYGQSNKGYFPSNLVAVEKQHMVTFANAPSQLYGNILNMLKFKNELKNA